MIRLYLAELVKQGRRPLHQRLLLVLPVVLLLGALLFTVLRLAGATFALAPPGAGLSAAAGLFGFFGVIFAVAVAASVGSSEYDFATARLVLTQEPRRWRHAIIRAAIVLTWLIGLLLLTAITGTLLELAVGLHRPGSFDAATIPSGVADLGRAAATAYPVILIGLLAATLARHLLGGIFAWLAYSIADSIVGAASRGQLPLPEGVTRVAEVVAPWTLSGLGGSLAGQPNAWPAAAAIGGVITWVIVLTALLIALLEKRDVT